MRLDVYHHFVNSGESVLLTEILKQVNINTHKINSIMATFEELSAKLDAQGAVITEIGTTLDSVDGDLVTLNKTISDLKATTPEGNVVITQDQLNALSDKADSVTSGLAALRAKAASIDAETPPANVPPPPPPVEGA